jgi:NitT/TauT family transport system substrate-binding protein
LPCAGGSISSFGFPQARISSCARLRARTESARDEEATRVNDQDRLQCKFERRRRVLRFAAAAMLAHQLPARAQAGRRPLLVGGLPVTCNLTLPVASAASAIDVGTNTPPLFEFTKYSGWPEIKESMMTGRLLAGYMLAPLVMDLVNSSIPVKVVSLGHRSGAIIMVRTESPYKKFKDLTGKRVAVPSRFAVDYLFLGKMLAREGMTMKDLQIVEMPPPDMPAALYAKAVEAYATGEPFGAAAQRAGYARPLSMTRDEWPNYICCVLTVHDELIKANRPLVQQLVNYVQAAGTWLDMVPANRTKAVEIASGRKFFNQDPKVLQYVMDNPSDRVTYGDLRLIRSEFEDLMQQSIAAATLKRPVPFEKYVDESFVKGIAPVRINL